MSTSSPQWSREELEVHALAAVGHFREERLSSTGLQT